jgi:AcrR family transcriptional regulator
MASRATATATKRAPGQRADAQRNHRKVVEAARLLFAERGLEAGMEDIARAAGVGVGTVYRHFPTKEDLLEALADLHFTRLAEAARTALERPEPGDAFKWFMRRAAEIVAADRALGEALGQAPGVCARAAQRAALNEPIDELIARAQDAGALRREIVTPDIAALMCGLGSATQQAPDKPWMAWERYVEIVLAGLSVTDGPPLPGPVPSLPQP